MNDTKKMSTKKLAWIGLMAALVFIGTFMRIKIPVGGDSTMLHLGNVFCILSGLLLGGVPGGLAAGLGSAIFDLSSEYASEFWITFINKFAMGWMAGWLCWSVFPKLGKFKPDGLFKPTLASIAGSLTYTALYVIKSIITSRYVTGLPWEAVWPVVAVKFSVSLINGLIAVVVSLVLYFALKPALAKAHLMIPTE
ncbi:MAG: ECF transporter S component [Eubacteriaceae bacterium]|jgi:uncharacterized membrane protein